MSAKAQIEELSGVSVSDMLRVIDGSNPAGANLRGAVVFADIENARDFEDPDLPMGPWERKLKKADWPKVLQLTGKSLARESKDLQLAVWFTEAATHKLGFAAVEPCFDLLHQMCTGFWETMFPVADEGEDFRINLLSWFNRSYVVQLNRLAVTNATDYPPLSRWDWLTAQKNIRLAQQVTADELEGCTSDQFTNALRGSSTTFLLEQVETLSNARESVQRFEQVLDDLLGDRSPSFAELLDCIDDVREFTELELSARPEAFAEVAEPAPQPMEQDEKPRPAISPIPVSGRDEAYARLAEVADYLLQIEPHSPAPYLVKKAIEWSRLSTADLYRDLFVKHQGEIGIFDLLGINNEPDAGAPGNGEYQE